MLTILFIGGMASAKMDDHKPEKAKEDTLLFSGESLVMLNVIVKNGPKKRSYFLFRRFTEIVA